jgi:hypothetical protein
VDLRRKDRDVPVGLKKEARRVDRPEPIGWGVLILRRESNAMTRISTDAAVYISFAVDAVGKAFEEVSASFGRFAWPWNQGAVRDDGEGRRKAPLWAAELPLGRVALLTAGAGHEWHHRIFAC